MVKKVVRDPMFLAQKSVDATEADIQIVTDLLDTLRANSEYCVGMAANMIGAFFGKGADSSEEFVHLKAASYGWYQKHLNQHNVIYLNMQQFVIGTENHAVIRSLEHKVLCELWEAYGSYIQNTDAGLADALMRIYAKTGKTFIILIF